MWVKVIRVSLVLTGVVLVVTGVMRYGASQLDRSTSGTVTGIERLPSDRWDDLNYLIGYQFMTDQHKPAAGTYLLENPPSLGEIPRLGSYVPISYSSSDPTVNQPQSDQYFKLDELFLAEFLCVVGVVLLSGGLCLR